MNATKLLRAAAALLVAVAPARLHAQAAAPVAPSHVAPSHVAPSGVSDLPLVEVTPAVPSAGPLVVLLTGDGGWAAIDKEIARTLSEHGLPVVGFNTRTYLSKPRTADATATDVERVVRAYMAAWGRDRVAIVGYSRGADIAPFVISRFPADLRSHLSLVAMLGLAANASFEFHWADLVRDVHRPTDLPVAPELARMRGIRMLCVYGTEERDSGCTAADSSLGIAKYPRVGDHHFDGDYRAIAQLLLTALTPGSAPPASN